MNNFGKGLLDEAVHQISWHWPSGLDKIFKIFSLFKSMLNKWAPGRDHFIIRAII